MKSLQFVVLKAAREYAKEHKMSGPTLREAIPFLNDFAGKTFVLKLGGSILDGPVPFEFLPSLIEDVAFLKKVGINVVLVHGGSRQLDDAMKEKGLKVEKKNGLRVTSEPVLELASEVFYKISLKIQKEISRHGYKGFIFGRETGLVKSKQNSNVDLGFVGIPEAVEVSFLNALANDVIPIVSSVTAGTKSGDIGFNVNADDVAGAIASELKAEKLILMTNVDGVLEDGKILSSLSISKVEELITKEVIKDGMIPKVSTCLQALKGGVHKCHIIKGDASAFINEILTQSGVGTEFIKDEQVKQMAS